jgi:hypothetical protein
MFFLTIFKMGRDMKYQGALAAVLMAGRDRLAQLNTCKMAVSKQEMFLAGI